MCRPWILIGNPENRRIGSFVKALANQGAPLRAVVAWSELLKDPWRLARLSDEPAWLRVESTGENAQVQHQLLELGGVSGATLRRGQIVAPTAAHRGFLRALDNLGEVLTTRPHWIPLASPAAIAGVFDKTMFHGWATELGVPLPERIDADSVEQLFAAVQGQARSVFVKLRYSSSASGIAVYRHGPPARLLTTVREVGGRYFNSLRVQRIHQPERIRALLGWLIEEEGAQIEWAVPKARLEGALFDCRVLMVAHEPAFVVVRHARHLITNLHLGGWRGSVDALRATCPPEIWEQAMRDCQTVSRAYGGLHLGLDVIFEPRFRGYRILEANAFGDLLPGLVLHGRNVYEHEIAAAPAWYSGSASR